MKLLVMLFLAIASADNDINLYVYGGEDAIDGAMPYQVGLSAEHGNYESWCGGALISQTIIITAAHCIDKAPAEQITAFMGSIKFKEGQRRVAREKIIHSKWDGGLTPLYDIGLLKINKVKYTRSIRNIALPALSNSYSSYVGNVSIISGWGLTNTNLTPASTLQYVELVVISNDECANEYNGQDIPSSIICAAHPKGAAICSGDSGGPLVHKQSKTLIGVVSFGPGKECRPHFGSAFTRVTYFRQWIKEMTGI